MKTGSNKALKCYLILLVDCQCPELNVVNEEVRYTDGCCGIGAVASITCDDGFQLIGDTLTLFANAIGLQCGYNSFHNMFVWAPAGDVYCGQGNYLFVLTFLLQNSQRFR